MPPPGSLVSVNDVIRNGNSLSGPIDLSGGTPRYIVTPADWNYAGGLSVQLSSDGTTFYDVFRADGHEFVTAPLTAGVVYPLLGNVLQYAASMKIRSGSREQPVVQKADRAFKIVLSV